jgi:FtsH-binding integral membrane protein
LEDSSRSSRPSGQIPSTFIIPMYDQQTASFGTPVSAVQAGSRARFVSRTYAHLLGAIVAFTGIEIYLFQSGMARTIATALLSTSWLFILGGFMIAGWLFNSIAARSDSKAAQYGALAGYVVIESIIFVPLLYIANSVAPGAISSAALCTLLGFSGLTLIAMTSKSDFSFLGSILRWVGVGALVLIVAGVVFGFTLGVFFSVAMVVFAGAAILYETGQILHNYPEDRYVAASLSLFASVALMFWYLLRIFSRD